MLINLAHYQKRIRNMRLKLNKYISINSQCRTIFFKLSKLNLDMYQSNLILKKYYT